MSKSSEYANISKGILYNMITVSVIGLSLLTFATAYVVYTDWMPIWNTGFKNFGSISEAIVELKNTTKPATELAPQLLLEIQQMNASIVNMDNSVLNMQRSVQGMETSVGYMSLEVPYGMHRLRNKMSPMNMMMPW